MNGNLLHLVCFSFHAYSELGKEPSANGKETISWFLINNLMVYFQRESKPIFGGISVAIHTWMVSIQDFYLQCSYTCSSRYVAFVELIHLNYLLDNVAFQLYNNISLKKCLVATNKANKQNKKCFYLPRDRQMRIGFHNFHP